MATLFIASGAHEGRWFPLKKKSLVLGRDESLLGQIVDGGVSRKHLTVRYDAGSDSYLALDMNSKNGVFVNDERVDGESQLKDDDLIRIGDTLLLFITQDFEGDNNALNFYRQRGERVKDTYKMDGENIQDAFQKLKDAEAREREDNA